MVLDIKVFAYTFPAICIVMGALLLVGWLDKTLPQPNQTDDVLAWRKGSTGYPEE
jgi:hypothetical protein